MDGDVPDPAAAVQIDGDVPDPAAAVQMFVMFLTLLLLFRCL